MKRFLPFGVLTLAVMLVALMATPAFGGGAEEGLERADQARQRHTDRLMAVEGVVGVALGLNPGGKASVLVLTSREGVPGLPREVDGVPVHVRVVGEISALDHCDGHSGRGNPPCGGGGDSDPAPDNGCPTDTTAHARPACIGMSTGHPDVTAGTIGARVKDGDGNVYALSNNHVYANSNSATYGDYPLQPGAYDGGAAPDDVLGALADFEPIKFDGSHNFMDAAIALSSAENLGNATPSNGYGTPRSAIAVAYINQKVMKYGRTTGQTKGQVYAINATVDVSYGSAGVARFVNQIVITPGGFSAGGDSGSLIVVEGKGRDKTDDRKPVGLLFAGSSVITIANPIGPVLDRFEVTVDGS